MNSSHGQSYGLLREVNRELLVLCRDSCSNGSEDGLTEDDRVDPQVGPPCIVVRVRASVPPHL